MALELIFGGVHIVCTVAGILRLQKQPIHLSDAESGYIVLPDTNKDGREPSSHHLIPPPSRKTIIRLVAYAGILSLGASVPLNFASKV